MPKQKKLKILELKYEKGDCFTLSSIKQNFARQLEKFIGGNSKTTRVIKASEFVAIVEIDKKNQTIDIKDFLKENLDIQKFSQNRVQVITSSIPHMKLEYKKDSNENIILDEDGENVSLWINELLLQL